MLFSKNIEPDCTYCQFGAKITDTEIACIKRGIIEIGSSCRKFCYDPIKREPSKPVMIKTNDLTEDQFDLDNDD